MKYDKRIFKISKMLPFKPIPKKLNKKPLKPPISHIIIDIRTKTTLDSLETKNRTNITIARRPGHIIIDTIRTKKTLDSLETKNRTNIIARRPTKVKTLDSLEAKNRTNIKEKQALTQSGQVKYSLTTETDSTFIRIAGLKIYFEKVLTIDNYLLFSFDRLLIDY